MKKHIITNKRGKVLAEVYLSTEESLKNKKELIRNIKEALNLCSSVITRKITISIYPTDDRFIIEKMKGVGGFSSQKNTILIYIHATRGWQKAVRETVAHELAHALALNYNKRTTLRDHLVFEGVAEHFRKHFLGGEKAVWVISISKKQAKLFFNKIRRYLNSESDSLYRKLFFGTEKYPCWAGYAIGYYVVEAYLKKQDKVDWKKIIKTSPNTIMKSFLEQNI